MNPRRQIPSVSLLLNRKETGEMIRLYSRESTVNAIREELDARRRQKETGDETGILASVRRRLENIHRTGMRRVVNGTGVLVHTNLGRAVLSPQVLEEVGRVLSGYVDLEMDVESGKRGHRAIHVENKINHLMGSEASLVVNNNAASLMLAINTLSSGKEVVVSRGELIEIGGSFRLPDIITRAGGILKEVGTTNKTRLSDYEKAVGKNTGMVLKIHTSNYRVEGFTEETGLKDLSALCKRKRVPLFHDAGSGLFADPEVWGFGTEPDPRKSLKEGARLVSMSGDKLLGGPQAGIVAGKKALIEAMKKNPFMRALRLGKLSLVALDVALLPFVNSGRIKEVPLFSQLSMEGKDLMEKAKRLREAVASANPNLSAMVAPSQASVGGGSMPGKTIPSFAVLITQPGFTPQQISASFRRNHVPVLGMFLQGKFGVDVRALFDQDEAVIVECARTLRL